MIARRPQPRATDHGLRWYQSLQFRLACLFTMLLAVLAGVAFYAADRLIGGGLERATFRHETAVNQRLLAETRQGLRAAEQFAQTLALAAASVDPEALNRLGESLLAGLPVVSYGLWPEPPSTAPGARRDSRYWQRLPNGKVQPRNDYNAEDAFAWWREPWYTPMRLVGSAAGCLWSAPYRDPLLAREVLTCSIAITGPRGFEGVATVSLDVEALSRQFMDDEGGSRSYALLADRDGRLLAISAAARSRLGIDPARVRSLADLAQKVPAFKDLAQAVQQRHEGFRADALRSARYDARLVSSLRDNSRDMSRPEAEDRLATVWNAADARREAAAETIRIERDPVFDETAYAVLSSVPGSGWQLISASPTREGNDTAVYLSTQVLVLALGGSALVLVLTFSLLRRTVIRPLRKMATALFETTVDGRTAMLDESGAGELRMLAHWHNDRSERLAEMRDRSNIATSQLNAENSERLRAQDALLRLGERLRLLINSVDEGLIVLDERGCIEDLNSLAEQWLSSEPLQLKGQPFATVFIARIGSLDGPPLPDLMRQMQDGSTRIDYPDGVLLQGNGALGRELGVSAVPLRSRFERVNGAVIVLRRVDAVVSAARRIAGPQSGAVATEFVDPVTGLGARKACERRVRELQVRAHDESANGHWVLLEVDFPDLKRIRETRSHSDADALAARCGERLAALRGSSEQVFRLAPERFAVLIEADTAHAARNNAEALRQRIVAQPLLAGESWIDIRAAGGLCMIDAGEISPAEVMRRAGLACDHARSDAAVVLHGAALEAVSAVDEELLWVRRIERGLEHRLFHLTTQSAQPSRSHLNDGEVFDVLLSLEDEEGFWAPLDAFLPVAERHLLGSQLDQWVVRVLFERLSASPDLCGRLAFCTVHLSADSLGDASFIDYVADAINQHPLVPVGKLCFSLRDDTLTDNPQQAARCLESLRTLGARVAIDHRSGRQITYIDPLRKLPINLFKLDARQFPRIIDDAVEQMLGETAIRLVKLNGARTLVSGIDSEAEATIWRRLGADYLQGQAIAKPSPVPFRV